MAETNEKKAVTKSNKKSTAKKSTTKKADVSKTKKVASKAEKEVKAEKVVEKKEATTAQKRTIKNKSVPQNKETANKKNTSTAKSKTNPKAVKEEAVAKKEEKNNDKVKTTQNKKKIVKPKKVRPEGIKEETKINESNNKLNKASSKNKNEITKKVKKDEINENLEEKKDTVKEETKNEQEKQDLITAELKEILETTDKPEYVQKMIRDRKKIKTIAITLIVTFLLIVIISTSFAILNMSNQNIINNVSVKNVSISNLSKEDAVDRLTEMANKELVAEINLKYGEDYNVTLKPEQIEFQYRINDSVEKAFSLGRKGNILLDNYTIIYTTLFGKEIKLDYTYNGELLNQFVEDINSKLPGLVVDPTYYIEDNQLYVSKGTDGIQVKKEELKNQIIQAILERNAILMADGYKQELQIPTKNVQAKKIDMQKIYSEIYCEPQNAYFETDPYKIYPDIDGVDLIISVEEAQNIINKEEKEEYNFELKITEAEITIDEIGTEAFPYLISQFSTKYDASNRNRSTNLKIAADKINGKVLMPGEEFSFNKIVGKRTVEAGYKDAAIYADGGVVDGLAGGICQISSTLYNSVLLANLQITERRNHSFTTSYSPAGRDATVVWGTTDFRFVNSRSYPIKLEASVNNGIAEFKIHGMQEETEYEVRILPVRTQSIPYTTTFEEDPALIPGQQVIKQAGHSGCKVTTYKELRLNGEVVSKEPISNDTYLPMRTIIRVAPGNVPPQ